MWSKGWIKDKYFMNVVEIYWNLILILKDLYFMILYLRSFDQYALSFFYALYWNIYAYKSQLAQQLEINLHARYDSQCIHDSRHFNIFLNINECLIFYPQSIKSIKYQIFGGILHLDSWILKVFVYVYIK